MRYSSMTRDISEPLSTSLVTYSRIQNSRCVRQRIQIGDHALPADRDHAVNCDLLVDTRLVLTRYRFFHFIR